MRFRQLFLVALAWLVLGSWASAADPSSNSTSQRAGANGDGMQAPNDPQVGFYSATDRQAPFASDGFRAAAIPPFNRWQLKPLKPGAGVYLDYLAERNGAVCYTMRTYMVKASEQRRDDESGFRGYSSCQLASTYSLRSAEGHEEWK